MSDAKPNAVASFLGNIAKATARELFTSAGREVVERIARSAYEAEADASALPWSGLPEESRTVWRRRVGNVIQAAIKITRSE